MYLLGVQVHYFILLLSFQYSSRSALKMCGGVGDAIDAGVRVAVCSTSNEEAVQTIVDVLLGTDISKVCTQPFTMC